MLNIFNKKNIPFDTDGIGNSIYFKSIKGINAKGLSGWCYYVNGKKLSIGSGSYKLKKEDKLE
jgi:hypothetical protein